MSTSWLLSKGCRMLGKLREPAISQKLVIVLLLAGLALLLVDVRFEHETVLGKKWQAWLPIAYLAVMMVLVPVGLGLWNMGGRVLLQLGFAVAPILGLTGFWLHSKGDPWMAVCKVMEVICMQPGKIPMGVDGPPVLAPLALVGLGLIGLLTSCAELRYAAARRIDNGVD